MHTQWSWKDKSIRPTSYEVSVLVPLARQARKLWVNFEWALNREEALSLRQGIREWTPSTRGRFRAFDKLVLATLDGALSDEVEIIDQEGSSGCIKLRRDGGVFRIAGSTTFDVAFGYAIVGADRTRPGANHVTEAVGTALVGGFRTTLGWDVHKLSEDGYQSVLNALYGLPADYGDARHVPPSGEPPLVLEASFKGPFEIFGGSGAQNLFEHASDMPPGVYLWTLRDGDRYRPWYVGQTRRSFAQRTAEHVASYLSGQYVGYELGSLLTGRYEVIPGLPKGQWPATLPALLAALPERLPKILDVLRETRVFVAALSDGQDVLDRVEGALGRYYKQSPDLKNCLVPGQRVPDLIPGDRQLVLRVSSDHPILGLPTELREPR